MLKLIEIAAGHQGAQLKCTACVAPLREHLGHCGIAAGARALLGSVYQGFLFHPEER